ncbi:MAG: calcium/sodium antiporter [Planctomycetes bacterium]|nr:calcium/sodium antiporter [Planctomycetota bacterium]
MYLVPILLIFAGLVLLTGGGEFLVRGSSALAAALHISPLVIGLTVVAFGTSAPELAVTVASSIAGETDIAVGNVVGSNICNVLFILGVSAMVAPLFASSKLVRLDVPLMIGASVFTYLLCLDGQITRLDGVILFTCLVAYITWSVRQSRRERLAVQQEYAAEFGETEPATTRRMMLNVALCAGGLVLLAFGSDWMVRGATGLARLFGVSDLVIGLTIVAIGTSLPEAAASVVASYRGERDIAVGNVIGSNLFNLLCVLGLGSIFAPQPITVSPIALRADFPVMIAVAVACLPVFFTGRQVTRANGTMLFGFYIAYLTDLVLRAMEAPFADDFRTIMVFFVIPLTALTLAFSAVRTVQVRRKNW